MKYLFTLLFILSGLFANSQVYYLIVGTYTTGSKSEGIYIYKFNAGRGIVLPGSKMVAAEDPSYLVVSPDQNFVYAVNSHKDGKEGEVSAFAFDKVKGELKLLNKQPTGGGNPCYVTTDSTGKFIAVANYDGGNLSIFSTNADGSLKPYTQLIQHEGYSVNYTRQDKPHVHCVEFSPDQKYLFATDLGTDRLYQYKFDPKNTKPLTEAETPYQTLPDGSGPRHFTFHPNGKAAYLLNELSGTVTVYNYNNGQLTEVQSVNSTTAGDKNERGSADIHATTNGKFLYTSNRGKANDITIYKLSMEGKLNETGHQSVNDQPRNFVVDPSGKFLLVGSRTTGTIQIFSINPNFGLLEDTGNKIQVEMPACLKLVPVK
jgi:6-phosphogluconolactonase